MAAGEKGITDLVIGSERSSFLERMRDKYGSLPLEGSSLLERTAAELEKYFRGELREFTVPVDLRGTPFELSVWRGIASIEWGSTRSYGEIASMIGRPTGARAVGGACGRNPVPIIISCHRVLSANGGPGGYTGGLSIKRALLALEGIVLKGQ